MTTLDKQRSIEAANALQTDVNDDWSLEPEQMFFLMQSHNAIETAFADDNMEFLKALAATDEFKALFADMGFDEAYDRYETMLEVGDAT